MIKRSVRILTSILIFVLLISNQATASVWTADQVFDKDTFGLNLVEIYFNTGLNFSRINGISIDSSGKFHGLICSKIGNIPCDSPDVSYSSITLLPPCKDSNSQWCISDLSFVSDKNELIKANYVRSVNTQVSEADPKTGLPQGGAISLWNAPGVKHEGGGNDYAIYAVVEGNLTTKEKSFKPRDFRLMVLPYTRISGNYQTPSEKVEHYYDGNYGIVTSGMPKECAWIESGSCGLTENFLPDTRVSVELRIGNTLTGWLMGRLGTPVISVTPINSDQNALVISAEPIVIPKIFVTTKYSTATPEQRALEPNRPANAFGASYTLSNRAGLIELLPAWRELAKDSASGLTSTWSVTSTESGLGSSCLQSTSKLLGLVTTNSMAYEGRAPTFSNDELIYKVGGFHFNPDGSVFKGLYSLSLRSEVARCLYGFTSAPIKATIQVTSESQTANVATTVMNEKDGWVNLFAGGFTFSSPVIKVKLTQESDPAKKTELATNSKKIAKKTITCRKGNAIRRITGINPKCP